jgi:hypothetical protein
MQTRGGTCCRFEGLGKIDGALGKDQHVRFLMVVQFLRFVRGSVQKTKSINHGAI